MIYKNLLRPLLFKYSNKDPEKSHDLVIEALHKLGLHPLLTKFLTYLNRFSGPHLQREVFGLQFPNPIGLAAGFDKNARAIKGLEALGFGFLEIGSITANPQEGNPKPRLFRMEKDHVIINRMGFNNDGPKVVAARLRIIEYKNKLTIPLGINLGKSETTPLEKSIEDYLYSFHILFNHGDYFAINVSSPNTPGLRKLQDKHRLDELLQALVQESKKLSFPQNKTKPILVKIAPDLGWSQIDEILEVCQNRKISGIIATNTTLNRTGLQTKTDENGGLSGSALASKSLATVRHIRKLLPNFPIIGVGGISTFYHAQIMLDSGANLIQIFTGLIYQGPFLVRHINKMLAKNL